MQLTAQAICLGEMLGCDVCEGAVFYAKTRRRERFELTDRLKSDVSAMFSEMHGYYKSGYVPKAKLSKRCNACSLKNVCIPKLSRVRSAREYLDESLGKEEAADEKTP